MKTFRLSLFLLSISFLVFILIDCLDGESNDLELVQVQILTRHGDRVPAYAFPSKFFDHEWQCPENIYTLVDSLGNERNSKLIPSLTMFRKIYENNKEQIPGNCALGQLTLKGMQQHFSLGQYFRTQYVNGNNALLNKNYLDPKQIRVESTDISRTLLSAQSQILGLYPDCKKNDTSSFVNILSTDLEVSELFPNANSCPKLNDILHQIHNLESWKTYHQELEPFKQKIAHLLNITDEMSFPSWIVVFDAFYCRKSHNLTLPYGFTEEMVDKFIEIAEWEWKFNLQSGPLSEEYIRLGIGPLLKKVKLRIMDRVEGGQTDPKFILYSGHDSSVAPFLAAFNSYDGKWPKYASYVTIELFRNQGDQYFVKMTYNGNLIWIPGCKELCSLEDWMRYVDPKIPKTILLNVLTVEMQILSIFFSPQVLPKCMNERHV